MVEEAALENMKMLLQMHYDLTKQNKPILPDIPPSVSVVQRWALSERRAFSDCRSKTRISKWLSIPPPFWRNNNNNNSHVITHASVEQVTPRQHEQQLVRSVVTKYWVSSMLISSPAIRGTSSIQRSLAGETSESKGWGEVANMHICGMSTWVCTGRGFVAVRSWSNEKPVKQMLAW